MRSALLLLVALPVLAMTLPPHKYTLKELGLTDAQVNKGRMIDEEVRPDVKVKLKEASSKVVLNLGSSRNGDEVVVAAQVATESSFPTLGALSDGDIMALCFIVLMEAAESAQEDLQEVMGATKAINDEKEKIREMLKAMQASEGAPSGRRPKREWATTTTRNGFAYFRVPAIVSPPKDPSSMTPAEKADFERRLADQLSDLGELGQLEMQSYGEAKGRRAKVLEAMSRALKRTSDSQSKILHNFKG